MWGTHRVRQRVAQGVEIESLEIRVFPSGLFAEDGRRLLDCLGVLPLKRGRLQVPAPRRSCRVTSAYNSGPAP